MYIIATDKSLVDVLVSWICNAVYMPQSLGRVRSFKKATTKQAHML